MYRDKSRDINDFIGETVTIFTTSGGMSGSGFTGVVIFADECSVRLVTSIGPAPGCALGNACSKNFRFGRFGNFGGGNSFDGGFGGGNSGFGGGFGGHGIGSVVDIPISKIAAVVRNAI